MRKRLTDKVKLILISIIIVSFAIGGLYWVREETAARKKNVLKHINKGWGVGKGIIVEMHAYKGHSIDIKYRIGEREYNYSGGWDKNPDMLRKGDSIKFRYALDAPELIVTELDRAY